MNSIISGLLRIPQESGEGPYHQIKSSGFHNGVLADEEDDFYYDTGDSLAFRLIMGYHFKTARWECELVRIRKYKRPRVKYWPITLAEADSVLAEWKLSR